jgi:hypothetical protein
MARRLVVALVALSTAGCAALGDRLAPAAVGSLLGNGDVFATEADPELARAAMPAALKMLDATLVERPGDGKLLTAAARAYALYAWAFPETDALLAEGKAPDAEKDSRARARLLYLRARDYGLRALEVRRAGFAVRLARDPRSAVAGCDATDVEALLWTGAAWGGAIAASHGDAALVADLPAARALLERAATVAPEHEDGAVLAALLPFDGLPRALGGDASRGRERYVHASALARERDAAIDVLFATGVARPAGDRAAFERALRHALAVDPDATPRRRLTNRIAQQRARVLLERVDDLFLGGASP